MRRRDLLASVGGAVAVAGCAGGGGADDAETTTAGDTPTETADVAATVTTDGIAFAPQRVSIDPGQAVRWSNEGGTEHDVTAAQFSEAAAEWEYAGELPGGASRTRTFDEAGVYEYFCTIHGQTSMCGAVIVGDASLPEGALPCEESVDGGDGDGDGDGGYY